jgi:hypothetical protein
MENLNKLHDLTLKIKSIIYNLTFKENDVRKAYFENLYSIVNEFYHGKIFFKISQEIKNGTIKFDSSIITLEPHVSRIYEVVEHKLLSDAYHNELNRKLFVDSFTNFETTISLCFDDIVDESGMNKIIEDLNSNLIKICKDLSEETKKALITELKKNPFIPLFRKFRYIYKLNDNSYSFDYKADLEFIKFCSNLRNCVSHSAGYYKGKDFEYEFENIKFIFKNEEFLEMIGENDYVFLKINERLTNIMYALNNCMKNIDFIKYPDDGF